MTFHKAKKITGALFVMGIVALVLALLSGDQPSLAGTLTAAGLILFAAGIFVCVAYCRCPVCNRVIMRKLFVLQICPYCKRNLATGLKSKKKTK